jgi:AI-2 transport protein TqsA
MNPQTISTATRWGIGAIIMLSVTLALYLGTAIFIPMVVALLLAAMLWPMATWMHQEGIHVISCRRRASFPYFTPCLRRWHVSWGVATLAVVIGFIALVLGVSTAFGLGLSKIFIDAADRRKQEQVYTDIVGKLYVIGVPLDQEYLPLDPVVGNRDGKAPVFETIRKFFEPTNPSFQHFAGWALGYGGNIIWQSILIMFILLFLLLEGRMLSRRVVEIFGPGPVVQGQVVEALKEMAYQVRAYLVWRTIINFAMAGLLGILYYLLGLKLAWTWALLTAILWYIPYIGPIAAGIPPVLDAFISCPPWVAIVILVFYIVWVVIEGYFVVPVVMGRSMEMNATTVLIACLYWEHVWGAMGLFLAMPLIAAVKAVCYHVPEWRPWANLMSSHEEDRPHPASEQPPPSPQRNGDTRVDDGAPHAPAPAERSS